MAYVAQIMEYVKEMERCKDTSSYRDFGPGNGHYGHQKKLQLKSKSKAKPKAESKAIFSDCDSYWSNWRSDSHGSYDSYSHYGYNWYSYSKVSKAKSESHHWHNYTWNEEGHWKDEGHHTWKDNDKDSADSNEHEDDSWGGWTKDGYVSTSKSESDSNSDPSHTKSAKSHFDDNSDNDKDNSDNSKSSDAGAGAGANGCDSGNSGLHDEEFEFVLEEGRDVHGASWVGNKVKAKQQQQKQKLLGKTRQVTQVMLKNPIQKTTDVVKVAAMATIHRKPVVMPKIKIPSKPVVVSPRPRIQAAMAAKGANATIRAKIAKEQSMQHTMHPVFITGDELSMITVWRQLAAKQMLPLPLPNSVPQQSWKPVPLPCYTVSGYVGAMNAVAFQHGAGRLEARQL